jgi:hypothetical protein
MYISLALHVLNINGKFQSLKKSKVKLSRYMPCRHMGGEEV